MRPVLDALFTFLATQFSSRVSLQLEILVLRNQLAEPTIDSAATHIFGGPYTVVLDVAALTEMA